MIPSSWSRCAAWLIYWLVPLTSTFASIFSWQLLTEWLFVILLKFLHSVVMPSRPFLKRMSLVRRHWKPSNSSPSSSRARTLTYKIKFFALFCILNWAATSTHAKMRRLIRRIARNPCRKRRASNLISPKISKKLWRKSRKFRRKWRKQKLWLARKKRSDW